jgi:hypothetical protein
MDSGMRFSDIIIHHFAPEIHMEQPPDKDARCLAQSFARPACPSARFLLGWDISAGASRIPRGLPISSLVIPGGPRVSRVAQNIGWKSPPSVILGFLWAPWTSLRLESSDCGLPQAANYRSLLGQDKSPRRIPRSIWRPTTLMMA